MIPRREFPRPDRARARRLIRTANGTSSCCGVPVSGVEENAPGAGRHRRAASFEKKGRLSLCFGGADYIADAYVNRQFAAHHQGGGNEFDIGVSDFRQSGENEICAPSTSGARRRPKASGAMAAYRASARLENRGERCIESFALRHENQRRGLARREGARRRRPGALRALRHGASADRKLNSTGAGRVSRERGARPAF